MPEREIAGLELVALDGLPGWRLAELVVPLSRHVHLACHLRPATGAAPALLPGRAQWDADALLAQLEAQAAAAPRRGLLLGVAAGDIAVPIFTFVFGRARQHGRAAVVSLARLAPEFYGLPPDPVLAVRRALAEMLHELGHLAGRTHCPSGHCLMSFAGHVERVDARGVEFCTRCAAALPAWLRPR